jgi:hypothetical protein
MLGGKAGGVVASRPLASGKRHPTGGRKFEGEVASVFGEVGR